MKVHKYIKITLIITALLFLIKANSQNQVLQKEEKKEIELINEINDLFFFEGKEKEAYQGALKLIKTSKTDATKSLASSLISSYFSRNDHLDSSIYYAKKTLKYKVFSTDSIKRKRYLMGTMNLASGYFLKGLNDKAKKIYLEGIQKAELWNDRKNYYGFMVNLGNLYFTEEEYNKALELFNKSLKSENSRVKVISYGSIGNIYAERKKFEISNEYYYKMLTLVKNDFYNKIGVLNNIADNLVKMGKEKEGILQFKKNIKESIKRGYNFHVKEAKQFLVEIYIDQKKYGEAEKLLKPILEEDKKTGNLKGVLNSYEFLKEVTKGKGDLKKALKYSEYYIKMKDSISLLQKTEEINALEVKFETLQKEKEIIVLKKDQEIKSNEIEKQTSIRNVILIASGLIIVSILLLLLFYFQKLKTQKLLNKTEKEINYQKIKALMKEQELELIKASIEGQDNERKRLAKGLHDSIGSSMAAIKMQLERVPSSSKKLEKIKDNLNDTYEQVRELSHNLLPKKIRQNDYAELLNEYLKNINEITDVKISFNISQEEIINKIDKFLQNEIFAVLQELITNTIKHAEAKKIDINLEVIKDTIHLSFEDNGKGFDTKIMSKGIGLKNIKNRIVQLSGSYIIDSHSKRGTLFKMEVLVEIYPVEEVV